MPQMTVALAILGAVVGVALYVGLIGAALYGLVYVVSKAWHKGRGIR